MNNLQQLREALEQQRKYERENWPFVGENNEPTGTGASITYHLASLYCWSPGYVLTLPPEERDQRLQEIWRDFSIAGDIIKRYEDAAEALLKKSSPTIVCLCGSTRFSEAFHEANLRETLAGKIVLSIGCDFKSDADLLIVAKMIVADKFRMDELHLRKIDLADEVLILNVGGYIGPSTQNELDYATRQGKSIRFLEPRGE
jgi:hypothetical protein